ncbi:MAG: hypothetical protein M3Z75_14870 [Actinomycetota bacterium]|nr:hypothetical protein [Actinomycetota bacterium]
MSITADLARDIAKALLDFAKRTDAAEDPASRTGNLPPIAEGATAQKVIIEVLARASSTGLPARAIAEKTGIAQMNLYEKLERLIALGYVEEVPGSSPKHWRSTERGKRAAKH